MRIFIRNPGKSRAMTPVTDLVEKLLANDGDDGQALVDAISSAHNTATEAVDALTSDEGHVGMNTAAIEDNTESINTNTT